MSRAARECVAAWLRRQRANRQALGRGLKFHASAALLVTRHKDMFMRLRQSWQDLLNLNPAMPVTTLRQVLPEARSVTCPRVRVWRSWLSQAVESGHDQQEEP